MSVKNNFCILQHVPFEGPGVITQWITDQEGCLTVIRLYEEDPLPPQNSFDWLIVMGGPMGVDDVDHYPWLEPERRFIVQTIESGKPVLGICLGAQLIAAALGASVKKNEYREIGWFNIRREQPVAKTILADIWPESIKVFHWHGDTFALPKHAKLLASSDACTNQGFILDNRIVGLQFHLEVTPESVTSLVENCLNELDDSEYVHSREQLLAPQQASSQANQLLYRVLDTMGRHTV